MQVKLRPRLTRELERLPGFNEVKRVIEKLISNVHFKWYRNLCRFYTEAAVRADLDQHRREAAATAAALRDQARARKPHVYKKKKKKSHLLTN